MEQSHEYETLYIISPDLSEEDQTALRSKVVDTIKGAPAEIIKDEVWGKRKLAYPIKKKTEGVYVLVRSKGSPEVPQAVDTFVKRTPDVLRHLTTVVTEQQVKEEARQIEAAAKKAEQARIAAEEAEKRAAEKAAEEEKAAQEAKESAESSEATSTEATDAPTEEASGGEQKEAVGE